MANVGAYVRDYMISPVVTVSAGERLSEIDGKLSSEHISAVPVVDGNQAILGVVSRTDLLRAGRMRIVENGSRKHVLTLPDGKAREVMQSVVEVIEPGAPLAEAARRMVRLHIHRLYATENGHLKGVVSTQEMMQAVIDAHVRLPIEELMTPSVVSVRADDPVTLAIDRMAAAHHRTLVVVDGDWPVGMFSQAEALRARDAGPEDKIQDWMSSRLLSLSIGMPANRAAQIAIANGTRSIIVIDGNSMRGIVTGIDFAKVVRD